MSFLDQDYTDVWEEEVMAEDTELKLRIKGAEYVPDKYYIQVYLEDPQNDKMKEVRHPLFLPKPTDEAKKVNNKKKNLQRFAECFNCPDCTPEDAQSYLAGCEGWVILGRDEDATYGASNRIKRYVGTK